MWNDVHEAIITESDGHDLRHLSESTEEEEEDDYEKITNEMIFPKTINIALNNAKVFSTPVMESMTSSDEQNALYLGAKVSIGEVMVLLSLNAIK